MANRGCTVVPRGSPCQFTRVTSVFRGNSRANPRASNSLMNHGFPWEFPPAIFFGSRGISIVGRWSPAGKQLFSVGSREISGIWSVLSRESARESEYSTVYHDLPRLPAGISTGTRGLHGVSHGLSAVSRVNPNGRRLFPHPIPRTFAVFPPEPTRAPIVSAPYPTVVRDFPLDSSLGPTVFSGFPLFRKSPRPFDISRGFPRFPAHESPQALTLPA